MRVLRCKGHGSREFVVLLVDVLVNPWVVKGAVEGVEEDFAQDEGVGELACDFTEGWVFRADREESGLEVGGQVVESHMEDGRGDVSSEDVPDAFPDGGPARLPALRLEFVLVREIGEGQVYRQVDCSREPESQNLAGHDHADFNQPRRVFIAYCRPEIESISHERIVEGHGRILWLRLVSLNSPMNIRIFQNRTQNNSRTHEDLTTTL